MNATRHLAPAVGVAALAGAVAFFAAGSAWSGAWLLVVGVGLLVRAPMRRYWERVERDDPAAPALRVTWMFVAAAVVLLALGITQLVGVGFHQDTFRGVVGIAFAAFAAWYARKPWSARKRLSEARPDPGTPRPR